jgi:hypothetical protein
LWRRSIWHPRAIPLAEWKYRHIKRLWLPLYDVGIFCAAVAGVVFGVPAIEEFYTKALLDTVAVFVMVAAVACLAGVAFPGLWRLEVIAKSCVLGVLFIYAFALVVLTADGDPNRGFVAIIALLAMGPPLIRMSILREERLTRDAKAGRK